MTTWKDFVSACSSRGITDPYAREAELVRDSMPLQMRAAWEDDGTGYSDAAKSMVYEWMIAQVTT